MSPPPDKASGPTPTPNGTAAAISTLASSSNMWVQMATVALVALSGFSNFAATWKSADRNKEEIVDGQNRIRNEVIKQVADIHQWIMDSQEEFHKGNTDTAANRKTLLQFKEEVEDFERRQIKILDNQNALMAVDSKLLSETHEMTTKLEELHRLEQMRGAPQ